MTPEQVRTRVEALADSVRNDPNGGDDDWHCEEDRIHQDVLRAIADGTAEQPSGCAREALKTREIEFSRWYS